MVALLRAGFFRELDHGTEQGPSIQESRREAAQPHEASVVGYLESAPTLAVMFSRFDDYFNPAKRAIATLLIRTDGAWCWPSSLPYYVREYHVVPPADFVAHMRQLSWRPPELTKDELDRLSEEEIRNASNSA